MNEANRRQVILLSVAVLAVVWGLYTLMFDSKGRHTATDEKKQAEELQSFVVQTTQNMAKDAPSAFDRHVIGRAEAKWERNPFAGKVLPEQKDSSAQKTLFVYTGYMETGRRKIAIINDMEYQAGDQMDKEGFFVKMVSPTKVIIMNKKEKTEFEITLDD